MIFNILISVVIALVSIAFLKTIVSWQRLQFYKKQGIKVIFAPLRGDSLLYLNTFYPENKIDSSKYLSRLVAENTTSPCIAVNDALSTTP